MSFPQIFFDATRSTLQLRCALPLVPSSSIPSSCTHCWSFKSLAVFHPSSFPTFLNWIFQSSDRLEFKGASKVLLLHALFQFREGCPLDEVHNWSFQAPKASKRTNGKKELMWHVWCFHVPKTLRVAMPGIGRGTTSAKVFFFCRLTRTLRTAPKEHQVPVQEEHDGSTLRPDAPMLEGWYLSVESCWEVWQ